MNTISLCNIPYDSTSNMHQVVPIFSKQLGNEPACYIPISSLYDVAGFSRETIQHKKDSLWYDIQKTIDRLWDSGIFCSIAIIGDIDGNSFDVLLLKSCHGRLTIVKEYVNIPYCTTTH